MYVFSDDNLLLSSSPSPPPVLPPGEPADTSDMVRGLGYLLGGLCDERTLMDSLDDHPEVRAAREVDYTECYVSIAVVKISVLC